VKQNPRAGYAVLVVMIVVFVAGCTVGEPVSSPVPLPTATATEAPTVPPQAVLATGAPASPLPTATAPSTLTPTPMPPTPSPMPPTATPRPATHTVCGSGCDFGTIQAALDSLETAGVAGSDGQDGPIIEIRDPVHTEAGIVVRGDVTIRGLGAGETIIQGHDMRDEIADRVFLIEEGATAVLERITIQHGRPSVDEECGGGILNLGSLTMERCVVKANRCNSGAGICTRGELTIVNSSIADNLADGVGPIGYACGSGAGIKCERGKLSVRNSTISGNISEDADIHSDRARGGGAHVGCNCTAAFTNTTISGNTSVAYAGGVTIKGALRLLNCTIANNRTTGEAGGVYVRGHLDFVNTIIANNRGAGGNCVIGGPGGYQGRGEIGLNSGNMVTGGTCDPAFSDDPALGPLADNGGETLTHALLPGSPAIDAVPAISCSVPIDQRGVLRPMVRTSAETPCDIGAFEFQGEPSSSSTPGAARPGGTIISIDTVDQVERLHALAGHSDRVLHLAFSGDGAHLASSSRDKTIRVWEARTGQEEHTFRIDDVDMSHIAFSPDGRLLASAGAIWDVESGQVVHGLERGREIPGPVAFSPDGSLLAVALANQPVRVWDVASGEVVRAFEEPGDDAPSGGGVAFNIAFSPDGALLAAGGLHLTVRLWDVEGGRIAGTYEYGNESGLHDVAFSSD